MFSSRKSTVHVSIAKGALESIFDECDRCDIDETGGRIVGTYQKRHNHYEVQVLGVIGPGSNAKRSPTSLFQDGEYQESVFRSIEQLHPEIEHLGNWHTHHVNGLATLSSGDKTTYQATVNHRNHNTDFFYALLVVRKTPDHERRYQTKHYLFRRHDHTIYEISDPDVTIEDTPALRPVGAAEVPAWPGFFGDHAKHQANPERVKDQAFFSDFYPNLRPLFSDSMRAFYWKGRLGLVDGSHADVLAVETSADGILSYSIMATGKSRVLLDVVDAHRDRTFRSARHAVFQLEHDLNRELYRRKKE